LQQLYSYRCVTIITYFSSCFNFSYHLLLKNTNRLP
jgi:predicted transposase